MRADSTGHPAPETHLSTRSTWLRAVVLGSDDAIVSTSSLMLGIVSSSATRESILLAGIAGLVAGAMSMAVGEYVSVSSQRDSEEADVEREKQELLRQPQAELRELTQIYVKRGLDKELAQKVAEQLSAKDRLGAHLRDELGIHPASRAQPLRAAIASAISFASFALVPIAGMLVAPRALQGLCIAGFSLLSLAGLGALGGYLGGAPIGRGAFRVTLGGAMAMALTSAIGGAVGGRLG